MNSILIVVFAIVEIALYFLAMRFILQGLLSAAKKEHGFHRLIIALIVVTIIQGQAVNIYYQALMAQ